VLVGTWVSANRLGQFGGPAASTALAGTIGMRPSYFVAAGLMVGIALAWSPARRWAAAHER
jgi:hypothetical protein